MTKQKRIFAAVMAAAVCLVMLFSAMYIIVESDHDCVGESCHICLQISFCTNALRKLSFAVAAIAVAAALVFSICNVLLPPVDTGVYGTLTALKVKLSE